MTTYHGRIVPARLGVRCLVCGDKIKPLGCTNKNMVEVDVPGAKAAEHMGAAGKRYIEMDTQCLDYFKNGHPDRPESEAATLILERSIETEPGACELARIIMRQWRDMAATYGPEAHNEGLSISQIGRFLGPLDFNGQPLIGPFDSRTKGLACIESALQWLERAGFLEDTKAEARIKLMRTTGPKYPRSIPPRFRPVT